MQLTRADKEHLRAMIDADLAGECVEVNLGGWVPFGWNLRQIGDVEKDLRIRPKPRELFGAVYKNGYVWHQYYSSASNARNLSSNPGDIKRVIRFVEDLTWKEPQ